MEEQEGVSQSLGHHHRDSQKSRFRERETAREGGLGRERERRSKRVNSVNPWVIILRFTKEQV